MSNIYYLCELDPKKAQVVINDFTTYLRNNFSSVVKQDLIPFSDELEHTKAFLAVVKARYENHLFTKFDTQFTAFRIPPLTLEPLVENAVKHGLDPELPPLHVWVRTQLADNGVIIIVENSGAELSLQDNRPEKDESDEPHIGLSNVSDRLRALCGGSLTISKRKAGGTIVIINIPLIPR
jgi:LytS/YehU family sensor histidine kinase